MMLYGPDRPSLDTETGGAADGGPILYTTTNGGADMAIQAAGGLTTGWRLDLPPETMVYADANLSDPMRRIGATVETVVYVGLALAESVAGGSRAVLIRTREPYPDGVIRWTIGYVPTAVGKPYGVTAPVPPDVAELLRQRDEMWHEWLTAGAPGEQ